MSICMKHLHEAFGAKHSRRLPPALKFSSSFLVFGFLAFLVWFVYLSFCGLRVCNLTFMNFFPSFRRMPAASSDDTLQLRLISKLNQIYLIRKSQRRNQWGVGGSLHGHRQLFNLHSGKLFIGSLVERFIVGRKFGLLFFVAAPMTRIALEIWKEQWLWQWKLWLYSVCQRHSWWWRGSQVRAISVSQSR